MLDGKKKRLSMLDTLANAGSGASPQSMMSTNRALRSARDAVDAHKVWDLDPAEIDDTRFTDRLDVSDIADLKASIEANGQTVPILVRRHHDQPGRYLLVYGRRRLEAVRASDKVTKVRALIAAMDDSSAVRAQVAENTARRDLSYIERALFAQNLLDSGFGNQNQIAEVLNTSKSAISMALTVANGISTDLARAIGPAHGIGRPRWEALVAGLSRSDIAMDDLIAAAREARQAPPALLRDDEGSDPSVYAFLTVSRLIQEQEQEAKARRPAAPEKDSAARALQIDGRNAGRVQRHARGLRLDVTGLETDFIAWLDESAQAVIEELHARWLAEAQADTSETPTKEAPLRQ